MRFWSAALLLVSLAGLASLMIYGAITGFVREPDGELFERLRALRKSIADAEKVPAYIVFSDAVLRAMAASVPTTERELLAISGIGPVKLERYGQRFLEALRS